MKYFSILIMFVFYCQFANAQQTQNTVIKPFTIGQTITSYSNELHENRTLNIYLPPSYHPDSSKTYPVIYLLDGSADEDFIHIVGLVQFGSFPWVNMLPESIVVGIANVDRRRDYTFPTQNKKDKADFPTTGGSAKFINYLKNELQPYIQQQFHVNGSTTVIGQSLGGLLATEILLKTPNLFNNYIIVSPSLWWDDESLLKHSAEFTQPHKVYLAVGKEGAAMENATKNLSDKISKSQNITPYFKFFDQQDHANILHLAVYDAFEKMFKK